MKPAVKLKRISSGQRRRWNPQEHAQWQQRVGGGKLTSSDAALTESRAERVFAKKLK